MPFTQLTTGAQLHYEDTGGDQTPLLVIHGWLGTAALHFPRVTDWLKDAYRVIGPSLRGYGQSTPKPRRFPVDFYHRDAQDVLAFMDALGLEQAHILGYSDGGEVALIAAGTAPERFKSVMTIGAVGYFGPAMRPAVQRSYPGDWITEEEVNLHGIADRNAFVLDWIHAMKHMIDAGGDVSLSLAPNIRAPLLLMLGKDDTLNPQEYGHTLVDRAPRGRLVMFDCGHAIHDLQWDAFQREVGAFLKEVNG